jgi:pyridoxamine 5'-phosphate oxidase
MELRRSDLDPDPLAQFAAWFLAAGEAGVPVPEAMALATAAPDGAPSARMVLLKGFDERGLVFFTSYGSRKGRELAANPRAALLFHWQPLGRQVRVEGAVSRVPTEESEAYFRSRPLGSRLSAIASHQSEPVAARAELEARVAALEGDADPPRPADWGGYVLAPVAYEFWQHRDDRLHDRFRYERDGGGWRIDRLQP